MMQDNVFHTFSPATLARAEKARKYFELAHEHRRLLEHLPPLKPDSSAPGNYMFETVSSPGSAFPEITRVPSGAKIKHALGREYNPIQSLRNRRIRIREKRPFQLLRKHGRTLRRSSHGSTKLKLQRTILTIEQLRIVSIYQRSAETRARYHADARSGIETS